MRSTKDAAGTTSPYTNGFSITSISVTVTHYNVMTFGEWGIGDWVIGDWVIGDWVIGDWGIGDWAIGPMGDWGDISYHPISYRSITRCPSLARRSGRQRRAPGGRDKATSAASSS